MPLHAAVDAVGFILHNLQDYVGQRFTGRGHDRGLRYLLMGTEEMKPGLVLRVFFAVRI